MIGRLLSQTNLELVGAQIITPDEEFVKEYADSLRVRAPKEELELIADYVERTLGPSNGRSHRSFLLLFRGENPCQKLLSICGPVYTRYMEEDSKSAETIRETYADMIFSKENPTEVKFFEPAVLTPRRQEDADADLLRFARFLDGKDNIVHNFRHPDPSKIERTLVILKPDNWKYNSSRPGAIIDMFSRTGLRIVGIKIHRFSLAQAMEFYSQVESGLIERNVASFGVREKEMLERAFELTLSDEAASTLASTLGKEKAKAQFGDIVEFMSGLRPGSCRPEDMQKPGSVKCMVLIYEGENAVKKIREVLGPTDPLKAPIGTVRKEFGSNVMVNSAHASDSKESYEREKDVVKVNENFLVTIIRESIEG